MNLAKYLGILPCLFFLLSPTHAQQESAPAFYPTVTALEQAVIPPTDLVALAGRLRGVTDIPAPPAAAPLRSVGERQSFWVINSGEDREFQVHASLRVVGEHIYLWVEDGAPIRDDELRALAEAFDRRIYPEVRALWGSEASPGIDGDPRLHGLFAYGLGPGVAAYFMTRHTYPKQVFPTSNQHEMFFFNLDQINTLDVSSLVIQSTVAHEFQHMIRANIQENDAIWLNEGFSSFTQLYLYGDPGASYAFLALPETQLNTWAEEEPRVPHYGASMLFIAYLYERFGLDALRELSIDPGTGLDAVDRVLRGQGAPGVNEFFADWVLANLLLDPTLEDGRFGYSLLPATMPAPTLTAAITQYPFTRSDTANQYAADYYELIDLAGANALDISLETPDTVRLIPTDAASGRWMWYSNRGDMSDTTLTRAFDLTRVASATLHYRAWYAIEEFWDYAYVMISDDGGQTWDIRSTTHTTDANPHSNAYGSGYTGQSNGWIDEEISLDDYAGKSILVRFEMITDDAISQPGIAIDDVRIPEIGYSSDFEADGGGWEAQGWVRIDNVLPQQVWVQAVQRRGQEVSVTRWLAPAAQRWTLPLEAGVDTANLVISPFAPQTTVPMPYSLSVTKQ